MSRSRPTSRDRSAGVGQLIGGQIVAALSFLTLGFPVVEAAAQDLPGIRCGASVHAAETEGFVLVPQGGIFCPLVADPKAAHSFLTIATGDFPTISLSENDTDLGSVGIGDEFALMRWGGEDPGEGVQLTLEGAVFAQFDLRTASFDLINADYLIGLPVTFRIDGFSTRLRLYHQSSHLGDEFLLRDELVARQNLSFESIELILSQEVSWFRAYAGGEYLFRREPETLENLVAHGGLELRLGPIRGPHALAAVDVKSTEQQDWDPAISVRAGAELFFWRDQGHPPRRVALLGEFYQGPSPYGQFFEAEISSIGLGLHFSM